jgi:hypothetical protein
MSRRSSKSSRISLSVDGVTIIYDSQPPAHEFLVNLETFLSPHMPLRYWDASRATLHSPLAVSWIELVFIFTSTTVATAILTKISEDVYDFFKDRLDHRDKSASKIRVGISINANEFCVQGYATGDDYEEAVRIIERCLDLYRAASEQSGNEPVAREANESKRNDRKPNLSYSFDNQSQSWQLSVANTILRGELGPVGRHRDRCIGSFERVKEIGSMKDSEALAQYKKTFGSVEDFLGMIAPRRRRLSWLGQLLRRMRKSSRGSTRE